MEVPITQKYTLSIEEASNPTGIGRDQIYDWAKTDDTFPVFKIGSKYVIESGLLHEWLRNRCKNRVGMESTRVMRILNVTLFTVRRCQVWCAVRFQEMKLLNFWESRSVR